MFHHNLYIILRTIQKYKSTFLINLIGLTSGIACSLFIYLWVMDELKMDSFHGNEIYKVMENQELSTGIKTQDNAPDLLPYALQEEFPEIKLATAVTPSEWFGNFALEPAVDDEVHKAIGQFAGEQYFEIFSFEFLAGDSRKVMDTEKSMVISESLAKQMFGTPENAIGEAVKWNLGPFANECTVTGIFKDLPSHSTENFDFVISYESWKSIIGQVRNLDWYNHGPRTFVVLHENADPRVFNSKITNFIKERAPGSNVSLFITPYKEHYLYGNYENGVRAGGRVEYVQLFSLIAGFILLIACINFMNLSTARATTRIKEVGVKKSMGASRKTLILQHLGESFFFTILATIFALALVQLLMPLFNEITSKQLYLYFDKELIFSLLSITILTGTLAGSYPAFYLSKFNPVKVLKGKLESSVGEVWLRKSLVVVQFTLSIILIVSVIIIYKQIDFVQSKSLGFDKDNIIFFQKEGRANSSSETFISELRKIPGVVNASALQQSILEEESTTTGLSWEGKDPDSNVQFANHTVDHEFIETMGLELLSGRTFSKRFTADTTKILFNEKAIEVMALEDPIGKIINLWGQQMEIIGIVKNFHFQSLHTPVKPLFFKLAKPGESRVVVVRIKAGNEQETLASLQQFYTDFNPGFTFDYEFFDQKYQAQYAAEQKVSFLSQIFAALAIVISCLGLFGLASFTAERKVREIGIRKVLGSGEWNIIKLLTGGFTKIVLTAIVIALPISYLMIKDWLSRFAYQIEPKPEYFIIAGAAALIIAWLTVGGLAMKVSKVNPVDCLKDE